MQTFMPYPDFEKTFKILDNKRLGKQRVETWQIFKALTVENYGWKNHPIVKMWKGYEKALLYYGFLCCQEWKNRGYRDNLQEKFVIEFNKIEGLTVYPPWIIDKELNLSHQSNLVRKDEIYYGKFFNIVKDIPYKWVI